MKDLFKVYADISESPILPDRPYVIANFAKTLDGVVSFDIPGQSGGGEITGFSPRDRFLMGLLRAQTDAVLVGAGTLRSDPLHVRTAEFIFPKAKAHFLSVRNLANRPTEYLNVFVTRSGDIDLNNPSFSTPRLKTLVITNAEGNSNLRTRWSDRLLSLTQVRVMADTAPSSFLKVLFEEFGVRRLLLEGGPRLFGQFLVEGLVDELFLTMAHQIAGRSENSKRTSLVEGQAFTPETAPWLRLAGLRRSGSHLFLRLKRK